MDIQRDVELRPHNSLALAARAAYFVRVENVVEARAALDFARDQRLRVTVLGGGSNVVLAGDLPGLTVQVGIQGRALVAERADRIHLRSAPARIGTRRSSTASRAAGMAWKIWR